MPAVYAHHHFGHLVWEEMQGDLKEIIEKYYTQYQIGLQGPDIFFFCRPWNGKVNHYGNHLHHISALPFFQHALKVVKEKGRDSAEYAYLLGFICHYILDSECHGYVEEMVQVTGAGHLEVEEEFEKKLLRMNGEDPIAYPVGELIPTDDVTAQAIQAFYAKGITEEIVKLSLQDMCMMKKVFTAPGWIKQGFINGVMKVTGLSAKWKGLMNQRVDNLACIESNQGLYQRFLKAIPLAVEMSYSFDESLSKGRPLHQRFDRTFE